MANIRIDSPIPISDGQVITFKSPADCSTVTGLIIYYTENEVETSKSFKFADAHGNNVGGIDLFAENVMVKVILDITHSRAYVQNADTNAYLEAQLASKAPADMLLDSFLSTAGWYKVGTVRPLDQYCGSLRITTDGSYFNNEPPCAVIDVIFGYSWASAKTVVASPGGNGGISKVALVKENGSVYGVYIYYNVNYSNQACLKIREMGSIFTPENFKAVSSFNETSASAVTDVYNASFAAAGYGFGEPLLVEGRTALASWGESHLSLCTQLERIMYGMENYSSKLIMLRGGLWGGDFYQNCGNCYAILNKEAEGGFASVATVGARYDWRILRLNGVWQDPEWVNPPMIPGIEYRTTERYNGKPVYTALVNCGNLPLSGMTETVWHFTDWTTTAHIFECDITYGDENGSTQGTLNGLGYEWRLANFNMIRILNPGGADYSGFTATARIKYWKG